jgi:DNA-binding CsgD family transcriptional regulator
MDKNKVLKLTLRDELLGQPLSKREQVVAAEMMSNLSWKEIAAKLNVSPSAVKHHAGAIYSKLGVYDRLHAQELIRRSEMGVAYVTDQEAMNDWSRLTPLQRNVARLFAPTGSWATVLHKIRMSESSLRQTLYIIYQILRVGNKYRLAEFVLKRKLHEQPLELDGLEIKVFRARKNVIELKTSARRG